jgi:hypothetical protein
MGQEQKFISLSVNPLNLTHFRVEFLRSLSMPRFLFEKKIWTFEFTRDHWTLDKEFFIEQSERKKIIWSSPPHSLSLPLGKVLRTVKLNISSALMRKFWVSFHKLVDIAILNFPEKSPLIHDLHLPSIVLTITIRILECIIAFLMKNYKTTIKSRQEPRERGANIWVKCVRVVFTQQKRGPLCNNYSSQIVSLFSLCTTHNSIIHPWSSGERERKVGDTYLSELYQFWTVHLLLLCHWTSLSSITVLDIEKRWKINILRFSKWGDKLSEIQWKKEPAERKKKL